MLQKVNVYAAEEDISRQAAMKRLKRIGVTPDANDKIDVDAVRKQWNLVRDERQAERANAPKKNKLPSPNDEGEGKTRAEAQRLREWIRAKREQLQLKKEEGSLIDAEEVSRTTEARFRDDADAILNWPARVAAEMAGEIGVEERIMHAVLDKYVRRFMHERAKSGMKETLAA